MHEVFPVFGSSGSDEDIIWCRAPSLHPMGHLTSAEMSVQVVAAVLFVIVILRATCKYYKTQRNIETADLYVFRLNFSPDVMLSRAVTAHKISKHITFLRNDQVATLASAVPPGQLKPLCLLLPWLGARPQAIAKYCEIYIRTGFDILVVECEVSQFLWPRWGLEYGARVLELLESERFSQRPLLVHALSIGGYLFNQVLIHVAKDSQRCRELTKRIRGNIFDSLVMGSLNHMAVGVGKTMSPWLECLVRRASNLYFRAFKRQTIDYFNLAVSVFWNTPVMKPALFFFSENDAMCDYKSLEEMIEFWRKRGITVESKKWEKSVHAGHLRAHPQEYLSTLESFVQSLNMPSEGQMIQLFE